ncbi:MAG: MFS transporter, partial [candidate division Zixibacteria bacterium]|nr:MFS transporter [candidate division Zixibacteria bacterium]
MFENLKTYYHRFDRRLWILAGGWVASAFGFSISIPFIAIYFHSVLGISLVDIGLFFGVTAIIRATTQAMAGEVSDRLGRYSLMVM